MLFKSLVIGLITLCVHGWAQTNSSAPSAESEKGLLQAEVEQLNALLKNPAADMQQALERLLGARVDFALLTAKTFEDYCEESVEDYESALSDDQQRLLVEVCQQQLIKAYRQRLVVDLAAYLKGSGIRSLYINEHEISEDEGYIGLAGEGLEESLELGCYMRLVDHKWKIEDLTLDGDDLSEYYRDLCDDILDKGYSLPVLVARLARQEYIVLENFSTTPPGLLPRDWGVMRKKHINKPKKYEVNTVNGRHFLAAQDTGSSVIVGKFVHWNPREYPIMTWCWRANALPPGGNERLNHLNDSAAGIYVVFSMNWLGVPKQIKYVWSTTLPEGTVDRRKKFLRPWFFVVESGEENLGKWTFEEVNIYEDYRRVFDGDKPKKRSVSIGVLTDANNTRSYAEAFYADFRVWTKKAQEKGLIEDYCACFAEGQMDETPTGDYRSMLPHKRENTVEIRQ